MQTPYQPTQRAWLLTFSTQFQAAVGYHEMAQILISPTVFPIATAPHYCHDVMILQNEIIPIMNVSQLLTAQQYLDKHTEMIVGIALYQKDNQDEIHSAGLYLANPPQLINVSDEQGCDLPVEGDSGYASGWSEFALSCFLHQDKKIPILDVAYLFSSEFKQQMSAQ